MVAFGGGTGLPVLLRGLRDRVGDLPAVVTVADDGGSSGRLRQELGVAPPGDVRNCLVALAGRRRLAEVFNYRFEAPGRPQRPQRRQHHHRGARGHGRRVLRGRRAGRALPADQGPGLPGGDGEPDPRRALRGRDRDARRVRGARGRQGGLAGRRRARGRAGAARRDRGHRDRRRAGPRPREPVHEHRYPPSSAAGRREALRGVPRAGGLRRRT